MRRQCSKHSRLLENEISPYIMRYRTSGLSRSRSRSRCQSLFSLLQGIGKGERGSGAPQGIQGMEKEEDRGVLVKRLVEIMLLII